MSFICSCAALNAAEKAPYPRWVPPWEQPRQAYQERFEKLGLAGLADLTKDKDTGVALQASWELHKKLVKRKTPRPEAWQSDQTYDPAEVKKFVAFLKDRTKAPVPDWWAECIADLEVYPRGLHLCRFPMPDLKKVNLGEGDVWRVRPGVELELAGGVFSYRSGDVTVRFQKDSLRMWGLEDALADLVTEKVTCLAPYRTSASGFRIGGFDRRTGERLWCEDSWAAFTLPLRRGGYHHRVELIQSGGDVFVFGAETGGMYVEAFDLATGKNRFRFCTSYWGNHSEAWKLK